MSRNFPTRRRWRLEHLLSLAIGLVVFVDCLPPTRAFVPPGVHQPTPRSSRFTSPSLLSGCLGSTNRRQCFLSVVVASALPKTTQVSEDTPGKNGQGIRLNKVFKATHSRREADALIESGRVSVNGKPVENKGGFKVVPFVDRVELDGVGVDGWEAMNGIHPPLPSAPKTAKNNNKDQSQRQNTWQNHNRQFKYIKYWKPRGVTCTTDPSVPTNIIDDLWYNRGYQPDHRVYPVGRLDKDTSGIILLTSDGRLPNSSLRGRYKQPKTYLVRVHRPLSDRDLQHLRDGVVITTVAQRDGNRGTPLTAPTLPCLAERVDDSTIRMTLVEGRNRQIRKMMGALEYDVLALHRVSFMGIHLKPLQRAGDWAELDLAEMALVDKVLQAAAESNETSSKVRP